MTSHGSTIRVRHLGDAQFSILTRHHELVVDQPFEGGGENLGPTPTELFVASLASCVAFYGRGFLHARGLADRVDVDARWSLELGPTRVGRIDITIDAPAVPRERLDAFRRAIEHCTVHNSLHDPPVVSFSVTTKDEKVERPNEGRATVSTS